MFGTNRGKAYAHRIDRLPMDGQSIPLSTLGIPTNEEVVSALCFLGHQTIGMLTREAHLKRVFGVAFTSTPVIGMDLKHTPVWMHVVDDKDEGIVVSRLGLVGHLQAEAVRASITPQVQGVATMNIPVHDGVAGCAVVSHVSEFLVVLEKGHGKRMMKTAVPKQKRTDKEQRIVLEKFSPGHIIAMHATSKTSTLVLLSRNGRIALIPAQDIAIEGANTFGRLLLDIESNDRIVTTAIIP
jgi:DNA gyrase/topoisomerase IV subunit A